MVQQAMGMSVSLLPGLKRLRAYQPSWLRGAALAGVTVADVLQDFHRELTAMGVVFAMARAKQDLYQQLSRAGVVERIGADRFFPTLHMAIAAFQGDTLR